MGLAGPPQRIGASRCRSGTSRQAAGIAYAPGAGARSGVGRTSAPAPSTPPGLQLTRRAC